VSKALPLIGMIVSGLVVVLFLADLAAGFPFQRKSIGADVGFIVAGAIIDKNVRIGRRVRIVNEHGWVDTADDDRFTVRDGVAVVPKDAVIPDGWVPEPAFVHPA